MYDLATAEPYSFWYILLTAKRKEDMFFLRFEHKMVPKSLGGEEDVTAPPLSWPRSTGAQGLYLEDYP